ncbi:hypothetical protein TD95_003604 [Thielaviopsis punctulata]|uniref:FAD-binding domain-containing protein n=1 Tax=Thielaviopsis punctulata TaxID=72032 RepID=A0A0F4Z7V9_9PEZI|nr:hypothetical protein TD95_003604 [Thielaviopsis punctulata]
MVHVAIIGAGISGTCLGIGLKERNISFTIYEKVLHPRSIGAGIGFSTNAETAMRLISPALHGKFRDIVRRSCSDDYFRWVDGKEGADEVIFSLFMGKDQFRGCRRSDFLEAVHELVGEGNIALGKEAVRVDETEEKVRIEFADGSDAVADIVIAADGIRSPVRHSLFPSSIESFTHKVCYRALLPMALAQTVLAPSRTTTQHMYIGPHAHLLTYPVANNTQLNLLVVTSDAAEWDIAAHPRMTARGSRAALQAAFAGWSATAHALIGLLPADADLSAWALYDLHTSPPPRFNSGLIGLAGDAAHASGPHLGAGGGMGVEDAMFLSELIGAAAEDNETVFSLSQRLRLALEIYSDARYERTMRVISDTRQAVDLFHADKPETTLVEREQQRKKFGEEMEELFQRIWQCDNAAKVAEAKAMMAGILRGEASYEIRV